MTSDETQIQIFADWPMSHAKRMTKENKENPEYHVVAVIRRPRRDKNCPAEKSWRNYVKKGPTTPQILDSLNKMNQRTSNENAAGILFFEGGGGEGRGGWHKPLDSDG